MFNRRIMAMAKKEVFHILRDPFTLAMALFMPAFLVLIFGFAIDFDIRDIKVAIMDQDLSLSSRTLADRLNNSGYFKVFQMPLAHSPEQLISEEKFKAVFILKDGFERDLESMGQTKTQILLDGTDNAITGIIQSYLAGIQKTMNGPPLVPPRLQSQVHYLYNPELRSQWFIVPGLSVVVLAILSIL